MGEDVESRKNFIQTNANDVRFLGAPVIYLPPDGDRSANGRDTPDDHRTAGIQPE